ncbi:MAG TPA: 2-C-methyl-D-erythritol 4-phosphate cytidylyltransferase [Solirubrobacteraceae bacterium]|nr:2-C-methyl-D-erythritol 4-phosphate cytidylyltransferase [Solirubrobacteraceae bacterium]
MAIALIVAAGSGERLGAGRPKALVELAGRPMLDWSLQALAASPEIEQVVVALPAGAGLPEVSGERVIGVEGGATRSESVRCALEIAQQGDPVLVHDAARPLLTPAIVRQVLAALAADVDADAAIAAAPVTDTIKRVADHGGVLETLDRSSLWAVQTPQVFRREALERALAQPANVLGEATDDAWLIERAGGRVVVASVAAENLKVTTPLDLEIAGELLSRRARDVASDPA